MSVRVGVVIAVVLAVVPYPVGGHNLSPGSVAANGWPDGDQNSILVWESDGSVNGVGHIDQNRLGAAGDSVAVSGNYVAGGSYDGVMGTFFPINVGNGDVLFPSGIQAFQAAALCDLEVLGPGNVESPEDEPMVDSEINDAWSFDRSVSPQSEGDWDDGGWGGACHKSSYGHASYNLPGCGSGTGANAEDAVSGPLVWIAVSCDTMVVVPGEESTPLADAMDLCAVRMPVHDEGLSRCNPNGFTCFEVPQACGDPPLVFCDADNRGDEIAFGRGNGHRPSMVVTPLPGTDSDGNACSTEVGQAATFTFSSVHVNLPADPSSAGPGDVTVSSATMGWIEGGGGGSDPSYEHVDAESDEAPTVAPSLSLLEDPGLGAEDVSAHATNPVGPSPCSWDTNNDPNIEKLKGPIPALHAVEDNAAPWESVTGNKGYIEYYVCATKAPDKDGNKYVFYLFRVSMEAGADYDVPDNGDSAQRLHAIAKTGRIVDREPVPEDDVITTSRTYTLGGKIAKGPGRGVAALGGEINAAAFFTQTATNIQVDGSLFNGRYAHWKIVPSSAYSADVLEMKYGIVQRVPAGSEARLEWSYRLQFEHEGLGSDWHMGDPAAVIKTWIQV